MTEMTVIGPNADPLPGSRRVERVREASEKPLVVGGAAGGVGQVTCEALHKTTLFQVIGVDRAHASLARVREVDLSDPRKVSSFFRNLRKEHKTLHGYVSLVWGGTGQGFLETSPGDFDKTWRDTFFAAFYPAQEAARWMKEMGGGNVVIVSSVNSVLGLDEFAYDAAKGAVNRIAPDIATSCGKYGVYATTLLPGTIGGTPTWVGKEAELERIAAEIPDGQVTTAQEVAEWIAFLLSGGIKAVNGQEIRLDRGWSISKPGFKK